MKKLFILSMSVLLVCVVVFVSVMIFNSTTVTNMKIIGNVQQVYFSGDDISFGDAKMLVSYQNGTMKKLDFDGNVKVSFFSTAGHGSYFGKMTITHKTQSVKVDYCVIDKTAYQIKDSSSSTKKRIIDFHSNGICRYFEIENDKFYMHDGNKDPSYNYTINGDTITVNLGKSVKYEIKVMVEGNSMSIISTENQISNRGDVYTRFVTSNEIKTNNYKEEKSEFKLSYDKLNFSSIFTNNQKTIVIPTGKSISDSGVCLVSDYDNGEIYYVYITTEMINSNGIDEKGKYFIGAYEGRPFKVYYQYK